MFESVFIRNIKGFDSHGKTISLNLKNDKYNICFAPNGFGKSSLASAFALLEDNPSKLILDKKSAFHNDETLSPEIRIRIDGNEYTADSSSNNIKDVLRCHVVSSRVGVSTTHQNRGTYSHVEGVLDIYDVPIFKKIPDSKTVEYKISELRKEFGSNGKCLANKTGLFTSLSFLKSLTDPDIKNALNHILNTKSARTYLDALQHDINNITGKALDVINAFNNAGNHYQEMVAYPDIKTLFEKLPNVFHIGISEWERFDTLWQLVKFYGNARSHLAATVRWLDYVAFRDSFVNKIRLLNPTWKEIKCIEKNGSLVVQFPNATQISNGQRDFLTFFADIERIRIQIELAPSKSHIVIIDEILDYLDDANMIALQHCLTNGLIDTDATVYTCMLTHLSPFSFRSYIFSDNKVNNIFLDSSNPRASENFLAYIAFRESLDRKNKTEDDKLYNNLSSYFFHYNPGTSPDLTTELTERRPKNIKTSWGKVEVLKQAIIAEINGYLSEAASYDPYAVCMGLRHRVEKEIYNRLPDQTSKDEFIATFMTRHKFAKAEEYGVNIPEIFNLMTALHNDADHVKINGKTNEYMEKRIVYSLRHPVIRSLIAKIFEYDGSTPLTVDTIL